MLSVKQDIGTPIARPQSILSRINLAVAVSALFAAGLFVAFDAYRTTEEAKARLALTTKLMVAELSDLSTDNAAIALLRSAPEHTDLVASLRDPLGQLVASTRTSLVGGILPASMTTETPATISAELGEAGILDIQLDQPATMQGVWQRGTAAFVLAFALIGFTVRPPASTQSQRDRDLFAALPFGIARWTADGALVACNDKCRSRLALDDNASYHVMIKRLMLGGYAHLVRETNGGKLFELRREDGSVHMIDERPVEDGGFVTLITDVTERKRTDALLNAIREEQRTLARRYHEEKLKAEAASRSKTSFLAHLSHDIRTPLNHIIGFAELLRHQAFGPLGDERYLGYADTIKQSGERLLASFATILDLAELEGGKKPLREEPIAVDELLGAIAEKFRPQALRAGLSFVLKSPCEATMTADRFCLERMLGNVVENAIRFNRPGGKVTLAAFAASDGVVLEITDTGIGMSEDKLATLSQPFVFGDATFTKDTNDSGLGIAIARAIAELSGGHLAIDSSPALGTTVAISLPLKAGVEVQAA